MWLLSRDVEFVLFLQLRFLCRDVKCFFATQNVSYKSLCLPIHSIPFKPSISIEEQLELSKFEGW